MEKTVLFEVEGSTALITLNCPRGTTPSAVTCS